VEKLGRIEQHEREDCLYNSDIKKCASPICPNKEAVESMILLMTSERSIEQVHVCSIKCATTLEFQNILNTSRS
jgi:hypothetical protein